MLAQGAFVRDVVCFTFYPFSLILETPPPWHVLQPPLTPPNGADVSEACRDAHCKRVVCTATVFFCIPLAFNRPGNNWIRPQVVTVPKSAELRTHRQVFRVFLVSNMPRYEKARAGSVSAPDVNSIPN